MNPVFKLGLFHLPHFLVAISFGHHALADEKAHYRVSTEKLGCVIENLELYRQMGDPVLIDLNKCPPNGSSTSLLSRLANEVPDTNRLSQGEDTFLALTVAELDCLEKLNLPDGVEFSLFYPTNCRLESE